MQSDLSQFRAHEPRIGTATVALCLSLALHGALFGWLLHGEVQRLAGIRFGPLLADGVPQLIELPDASRQQMPIVQIPTSPPEPDLGAPDGHGTSVDQTPGSKPQQARQAELEQPLLRLNPGLASNDQSGALKGNQQPLFGVADSGASSDDMSPRPPAAPARDRTPDAQSAAAQKAKAARAQSVVVSASSGSAAPQPTLETSKKPDAELAQAKGIDAPRNPDALIGPPHQATVAPNAVRDNTAKQEVIAAAGLNDANTNGPLAQAQPGGPPDARAAPDALSTHEVAPPPQATAQSTGPRTDKTADDDPDKATDPQALAAKTDGAASAEPTAATPDGAANNASDSGAASAPRAAAPGDPAPQGRTDSDPFSTTASVSFRAGREDVKLGFHYRITKPHILLKGWVDSQFMGSHTVTLQIKCDKTGNVINAVILKSSGSADIDEPSRLEAYNWWFEPPKDARGQPQQRNFPFTLRYYD